MHVQHIILAGLGSVGRGFLKLVLRHDALLRQRYGVTLQLVGVADSSGVAYSPEGLDSLALQALKRDGRGVAELPRYGKAGVSALALVQQVPAELLLEATQTNLHDGHPTLAIIRAALRREMHAILASTGPLALAYQELVGMSDLAGRRPALRFSGAVGGALPTVNIGWRDLAGSHITRLEAVLNAPTQLMLDRMGQGRSYTDALADARDLGLTGSNPFLDVNGWDAAAKLVIIANAVLDQRSTLADVMVQGIRNLSVSGPAVAQAHRQRVSLLAQAEATGEEAGAGGRARYRLSVVPQTLFPGLPLINLEFGGTGIVYESDIYGRLVVMNAAPGPLGVAAAMLRDLIAVGSRNVVQFSGR